MKITVWIHASCTHTALISFSLIVFAFHASGLYLVWVIFAFTAVLLTCLFFRFVRYCSSRFKFIKTLTTGLRCHSLQRTPHYRRKSIKSFDCEWFWPSYKIDDAALQKWREDQVRAKYHMQRRLINCLLWIDWSIVQFKEKPIKVYVVKFTCTKKRLWKAKEPQKSNLYNQPKLLLIAILIWFD